MSLADIEPPSSPDVTSPHRLPENMFSGIPPPHGPFLLSVLSSSTTIPKLNLYAHASNAPHSKEQRFIRHNSITIPLMIPNYNPKLHPSPPAPSPQFSFESKNSTGNDGFCNCLKSFSLSADSAQLPSVTKAHVSNEIPPADDSGREKNSKLHSCARMQSKHAMSVAPGNPKSQQSSRQGFEWVHKRTLLELSSPTVLFWENSVTTVRTLNRGYNEGEDEY
ncbi:hypothetical protein CDAR_113791 [Caerostris darwini]|uniref:Uncharacterized protein n=1 Tax=Caerostris darwini TaxID=1538125 RepID=A0AAV4V0A9_9ARAC|nr:hypothetical protein CDAR_113791 [Caerostris darwini]